VIRTPALDRLAAEGVRLTDCYAAAPNCSPARAGFLTGLIPARTGVFDVLKRDSTGMRLRPEEVTIAELLREAGYRTFHAGKWHLTTDDDQGERRPPALDHGFDASFPVFEARTNVDDFIRWLDEEEEGERPFFAFLSLHEPHEEVDAAADFESMYAGPEAEAAARRVAYLDSPRALAQWEKRGLYFGCVSEMDAELGRLFDHLRSRQRLDSTFVYFTSDNGPESRMPHSFGSAGPHRGAKSTVWEGGIRVPGIVRYPPLTGTTGSVSSIPVSGIDLAPTLCALAGIEVELERPFDGASFLPALRNEPIARPHPLYWGMWCGTGGVQYALREGRWKVLAGTEPLLRGSVREHIAKATFTHYELYDLSADPGESRDLAASQPEELARLSAALRELHAAVIADAPEGGLDEHRVKARLAWPERPSRRDR
jgi:arylsulfatase A